MYNDFSLFFEIICFRLFSLFIISSFEHIFHILSLMIELRNLQIHRKKNFLKEQKIKKYQSKATLAKDRNSDEFFFQKNDNIREHQIRMSSIRIIEFENRKKKSSDREFQTSERRQTSKRRQKAKQEN